MKKTFTARELSRISQKYHLGDRLTEEEESILQSVLEWEKSEYEINIQEEEDDEDLFESLFFCFYGVKLYNK